MKHKQQQQKNIWTEATAVKQTNEAQQYWNGEAEIEIEKKPQSEVSVHHGISKTCCFYLILWPDQKFAWIHIHRKHDAVEYGKLTVNQKKTEKNIHLFA